MPKLQTCEGHQRELGELQASPLSQIDYGEEDSKFVVSLASYNSICPELKVCTCAGSHLVSACIDGYRLQREAFLMRKVILVEIQDYHLGRCIHSAAQSRRNGEKMKGNVSVLMGLHMAIGDAKRERLTVEHRTWLEHDILASVQPYQGHPGSLR